MTLEIKLTKELKYKKGQFAMLSKTGLLKIGDKARMKDNGMIISDKRKMRQYIVKSLPYKTPYIGTLSGYAYLVENNPELLSSQQQYDTN